MYIEIITDQKICDSSIIKRGPGLTFRAINAPSKTSGVNLMSPHGDPRKLHDLRHTHASNMIYAGLNIKLLQERMGHSTASITLDVYGHIFKKDGEAQYLDALTKWEAAL